MKCCNLLRYKWTNVHIRRHMLTLVTERICSVIDRQSRSPPAVPRLKRHTTSLRFPNSTETFPCHSQHEKPMDCQSVVCTWTIPLQIVFRHDPYAYLKIRAIRSYFANRLPGCEARYAHALPRAYQACLGGQGCIKRGQLKFDRQGIVSVRLIVSSLSKLLTRGTKLDHLIQPFVFGQIKIILFCNLRAYETAVRVSEVFKCCAMQRTGHQ